MLSIESQGSFQNTEKFLKRMSKGDIFKALKKYGEMGENALANATPRRSGETANSWYYKVEQKKGSAGITWYNSHTNKGAQIAILIQYGHGTGNGGYVQGLDYINPALRPIFEKIAAEVWREVTNA